MSDKLFGTDGIRGTANLYPMTAEMALRIGAAVGRHFRRDGKNGHRVVIGKDTRLSGYMFENALTAGLTSTGMNVLLLGPVPTPAVGYLARSMRADLGIMISASHNPHTDNGIKFFGPDGFKLSDEAEAEIEALVAAGVEPAHPTNIGRARRVDDGLFRYIDRVKGTVSRDISLEGLRIVIDCANGAAYRAAPEVLWELGAEVIKIGVAPDGMNINAGCGSTDPAKAAQAVRDYRADLGICLDGDADRVTVIDETGAIADGDHIMALLATRAASAGQLQGGGIVATVMSNLGLETFLASQDIVLHRTSVGDRHVVEAMRQTGCNIGGEQSGHIVLTDHFTTGDGLAAGLQIAEALATSDMPASRLLRQFDPVPQVMQNLRIVRNADPLATEAARELIAAAEARLGAAGRLLIRKSGTEPLLRVMAEGPDRAAVAELVSDLCQDLQSLS